MDHSMCAFTQPMRTLIPIDLICSHGYMSRIYIRVSNSICIVSTDVCHVHPRPS